MGKIVRELKSIPGLVLGTAVALIITMFVLQLIQNKAPAPVSTLGGWAFSHANGSAYGSPAAPAMATTSPYSLNGNLGPAL